jgi:hypothetical protein
MAPQMLSEWTRNIVWLVQPQYGKDGHTKKRALGIFGRYLK